MDKDLNEIELSQDHYLQSKQTSGRSEREEMFQSDKTVMSTQETETIRHGQENQLTIFYEGTMNVYDNVPIDKAHAIMLLAAASSMYDPLKRRPTTTTGGLAASQLPSVSELEADLPTARKHSLQNFFERRRDRVKNKAG